MALKLVIIGRPNVGKSTLFNRLVGSRQALVDNTSGVTIDRQEGVGYLSGFTFRVFDTPGLDEQFRDDTGERVRRSTMDAVKDADGILFVIDARAGVTPLDEVVARNLREAGSSVLLVANKCEAKAASAGLLECFSLGYGAAIPISAEHGKGLDDLASAVTELAAKRGIELTPELASEESALKLAIVGRPNVGKSTLINSLVEKERLLTGPKAGLTRDTISVSWEIDGQRISLTDTAGLRKQSKVRQKLEGLSRLHATKAIDSCEVAVLLVDGQVGIEKQDLAIAEMVIEAGRALVIAISKSDLLTDKESVVVSVRERLELSLPQARGVVLITISSITGLGVGTLLPAVLQTYEIWNRRVPTGLLNRWLKVASTKHPPPAVKGKRIRLRYVTQSKTRPPTFIFFTAYPDKLPTSYIRYLTNDIRREFSLPGVPIRVFLRKSINPFVPNA